MSSRSTNGHAAPPEDPNRIIAIVTGANSGFGLGICHALLENLSVPSGTRVPASVPQASALSPSLVGLAEKDAEDGKAVAGRMPSPHPTLTLILACRSASNANNARDAILAQHRKHLDKRRRRGEAVPDRWEEGLRVEFELVDLDAVGGPRGILAFCERVKARYPHVTSLFLNAGYAAFTQVVIPQFIKQMLTDGPLYALHHPRYNIEGVGLRSADGERGKVWGVNVLAPYILTQRLAPLLRASPKTLPFEPRVVYTSSIEAEAEGLKENPKDDYQLLGYDMSYRASKYMGDLVMTQLDAELGQGDRPVRCTIGEPGCVATNIAVAGFGAWAWLVQVKWAAYWFVFWLANMLGSPHHPVWASFGAVPMLYAAFIGGEYLVPASKVPGPKMHVVARRWRTPTVQYGEVDAWEGQGELAGYLARQCGGILAEWLAREGLD